MHRANDLLLNKKVVELIDLMQPLATAETSEENSVEKSCFQRYWPKKSIMDSSRKRKTISNEKRAAFVKKR